MVTCNAEQRVVRFAARQKIDVEAARKEVVRRMAAQLPDEEKIKAADYVIDNSGSLDQTREQVRVVWERLWRKRQNPEAHLFVILSKAKDLCNLRRCLAASEVT